jgi:FlaA1/EpsC-like NDP-sugar epimerase
MIRFIQSLHILPRWIILSLDIAILAFSLTFAYFIRFDFNPQYFEGSSIALGFGVYLLANLLSIIITQSYAGIIRHTGLQDGYRIAYTTTLGVIFTLAVNYVYLFFVGSTLIPLGVIIIAYLNALIFLIGYRILVKYIFGYYAAAVNKKRNVVVFGSGKSAQLTKQIIDSDTQSNVKVVAFLEDDPKKAGKVLNGVRIYNAKSQFEEVVHRNLVKELILSQSGLSLERKNQIVDRCLVNNIKVRSIPPAEKWIRGELSYNQIKSINIEDLLGRESIKLNSVNITRELQGKVVMITGAAGSIGSELARQVIQYKPKTLLLIDNAESALFEVLNELKVLNGLELVPVIADVTDYNRMGSLFDTHQPQIVLHAAAYKHVPLMEDNPLEAVKCNVFGTRNVANLAVKHCAEKFVMVSTDKAVNPTSVMGASKRIAEIYVQSLSQAGKSKHTSFITTRFGNVLGSNGSVIPVFKKQIERREPLTVTHPEVTRYFMTIPEACQLVLEAGAMGNGGEIYIFDMGKSVKVIDLAKKMVKLSGLELGRDIDIRFTGLRKGEKLYEELLNNEENTLPTHHPKIMIAKITLTPSLEYLPTMFGQLEDALRENSEKQLVKTMKAIVPEYISNVSRFETLDREASDSEHAGRSPKSALVE